MRRILGSAFLLALAIVAIPLPAAADTSDFTFDSFDADYTLSRADDGTSQLAVVETIVARFPDFDQNRGIIRAIPDDYDGVQLNTQVESVVDENGSPVPFESTHTSGFLELALGADAFVQGAVTYVITYSQQNVVRSFVDTKSDEFYWDVNGTGWGQPFDSVTAAVHVDASVAGALTGNSACYVGGVGDTTRCAIVMPNSLASTVSPTATPGPLSGPVEFRAAFDNLAPGETLTVSIGFETGTFLTPEPVVNEITSRPIPVGLKALSAGIGLLSLGGVAGSIIARRRSRDPERTRAIIPQYSEPDDITIMQAAHLVSRPATAVPAALVRLAVRKNIRILAYAVAAGGEPYTLQYLGSATANPEDEAIIALLFGSHPTPGALREFGPSERELMTALTNLSARAASSLDSVGFRTKPAGRAIGWLIVVGQVVLAFVALSAAVVMAATYLSFTGWLGASMLVGAASLIACIVLAVRPRQLTQRGADARDYLEGMKLYLTIAEQDRLRALQSPEGAERINVADDLELVKLYEKLLPWAVVWGVEDQWMNELAVRAESLSYEPDWFAGADGFTAALATSTLRGVSNSLTPPVSASGWSGSGGGSSFSGGSFGGGFSGGGGGGGGGGGR